MEHPASPTHAVVGCTDLEASTAFFAALGFVASARRSTDGHALGLDGPTEQVIMRSSGARSGWIRLIAAPHAARARDPFAAGAYDLSLYTTDIERSGDVAAKAGAHVGPVGVVDLGAITLTQRMAIGPDDVRVVFIDTPQRRPSILDTDPDRLHSELHSIVWCVPSIEEALGYWTARGMVLGFVIPIVHPAVASFLELPRAPAAVRMAFLSDSAQRPPRFELLEFGEDPGAIDEDPVLRAGIWALGFSAREERVELAPGGVRFVSSPPELEGGPS